MHKVKKKESNKECTEETNKNTENEKIKHLSLQVTLLNFFATLRLYTAVIVKMLTEFASTSKFTLIRPFIMSCFQSDIFSIFVNDHH